MTEPPLLPNIIRKYDIEDEEFVEDTEERAVAAALAGSGRVMTQKRRAKGQVADGGVAKFPREKFMKFVGALKIQSKDEGLVPLRLLGSQQYVLDEIISGLKEGKTTFVILKGRQQGISTLLLVLDLFWAFEYPGLLGVFATHDEASRDQFRNQIDVFLKSLPKSHRIPYTTSNRTMLVLENGSLFRYLVAGTRTTTNKMGRSGGCNFCHSTEVGFWGSVDDLDALQQTFSERYPHRMYVFESTANGFNHLEEMYHIAQDSPAQKAIFSGWWRDERNEFGAKHPLYIKYMPEGVKTILEPQERQKIADVKKEYGFQITAGQIAWYRCHLETKCRGDQTAMDQEHPWTEEDAFVASGTNLFSRSALTHAMKDAVRHWCMPFMFRLTQSFTDTYIVNSDIKRAHLKIWEKPQPHGVYVIGADPIFGSSEDSDNGVISIYRAYADGVEQVAEYASPGISPHQFAWVLAFLCGLYKDVTLMLELNGPGQVVLDELKRLRRDLAGVVTGPADDLNNCLKHMKHFLYVRADSLSGGCLLQWKSTGELRNSVLFKFKDGIDLGRCRVRSLACLNECRVLMLDGGHVYTPPSKYDDRVFGSAMAYWCWDKRVRNRMAARSMTIMSEKKKDDGIDPEALEVLVKKHLREIELVQDDEE